MKTIASVETMRICDRAAGEGLPFGALMERAGAAVADAADCLPPAAIVCGTGNNAGDGFVIARLLHQRGIECEIYLCGNSFSDEGKHYFRACLETGIPVQTFAPGTDLSRFHTIYDCILGTGFHGTMEGMLAAAAAAINQSGATVISVDINSGLGGNSGLGAGSVRSDLTLAIASAKPGHYLGDAKDRIGELRVLDIGIPVPKPDAFLLEPTDISDIFAERKRNVHKGVFGYVSLIGGSLEYSGAAKLANLAASALRSGAGVVRLCTPGSLADAILPYLLESTYLPLADAGDGHYRFEPQDVDRLTAGTRSVAVGMGLGKSRETQHLLHKLLTEYRGRLVIDADGLNTLAEMDPDLLRNAAGPVILTPHLKEFERISGIPIQAVQEDPVQYAASFAEKTGTIVLLKGSATVITDGACSYVVDRGSSGMATAGSGDVLSGILAGMLGYAPDDDLLRYVAAGAYLNGLAGERAASESTTISALSGDTVRAIPDAVRVLQNSGKEPESL